MLAASSHEAVRHDFTDVVAVVLLSTAAVALLTFGLAFLLPRHAAPARS